MANKIRTLAISVSLVAVCAGAWISHERSQTRNLSDTIIGRWDRLGGEPWLLPNLEEARVFQPDRPHSFQEVHAWRQGEGNEIGRVREYALNTNAFRLR